MPDPIAAAREAEGVEPAGRELIPRLADVMARAFEDDPVAEWLLPDASRRMDRMERTFALLLRHVWIHYDACYATPAVAGAAVWVPPGKAKLGPIEQLRPLPGFVRILGRELLHYMRNLAVMEKKHPHEREHWYLPFLGVAPEWQGKGIGSALMRPVLDRCDRDGVPAYLEASTQRNRALYLRQGFEDMEEYRLPGGGPPVWKMWRDPQR